MIRARWRYVSLFSNQLRTVNSCHLAVFLSNLLNLSARICTIKTQYSVERQDLDFYYHYLFLFELKRNLYTILWHVNFVIQ